MHQPTELTLLCPCGHGAQITQLCQTCRTGFCCGCRNLHLGHIRKSIQIGRCQQAYCDHIRIAGELRIMQIRATVLEEEIARILARSREAEPSIILDQINERTLRELERIKAGFDALNGVEFSPAKFAAWHSLDGCRLPGRIPYMQYLPYLQGGITHLEGAVRALKNAAPFCAPETCCRHWTHVFGLPGEYYCRRIGTSVLLPVQTSCFLPGFIFSFSEVNRRFELCSIKDRSVLPAAVCPSKERPAFLLGLSMGVESWAYLAGGVRYSVGQNVWKRFSQPVVAASSGTTIGGRYVLLFDWERKSLKKFDALDEEAGWRTIPMRLRLRFSRPQLVDIGADVALILEEEQGGKGVFACLPFCVRSERFSDLRRLDVERMNDMYKGFHYELKL